MDTERKESKSIAFQQGGLDWTCGIYAVLNTIKTVLPGAKWNCNELHAYLITTCFPGMTLHETLTSGMTPILVNELLTVAQSFVYQKWGKRIEVTFVRCDSNKKFIRHLKEHLKTRDHKVSAVVHYGKHFTSAFSTTPKLAQLRDSCGKRSIRLSELSPFGWCVKRIEKTTSEKGSKTRRLV